MNESLFHLIKFRGSKLYTFVDFNICAASETILAGSGPRAG